MIETVIQPDQRGLALAEAYDRRELLYFLIWRDIKIRYKQTVLGIVWAVLVPVVQLVIFSVIFGRLAGIKPDGDYPYTLFVLAGLVPWTFFAQSVTQGGQSLVNQQHLLTKVYFPRLFVPTGTVGGCVVDLLISFGVFAAVIAWYRFIPAWQVIFVPVLIAWTILVSLGAVYLLSALTVAYRDFRYVIPVMIQTLMFLSPVVYSVEIFPELPVASRREFHGRHHRRIPISDPRQDMELAAAADIVVQYRSDLTGGCLSSAIPSGDLPISPEEHACQLVRSEAALLILIFRTDVSTNHSN